MPTTCPDPFTSAPPESPGTIAASVWMTFVRCSDPPRSLPAVMSWFRAEMLPSVTVGAPPRPSALPMATTLWPTDSVEESATVTVGRPDTPWIWRSATSSVGSAPITFAIDVPECPAMVTRMLVAPAITWLLVRISPVEVRITPVPAPLPPDGTELLPEPLPSKPPMSVLMSTTAGLTLSAMAWVERTLPGWPAEGLA